jgi:hypothetical protein
LTPGTRGGLKHNPALLYVGTNAKISLYVKKCAIISVIEIGDSKRKNLKYVSPDYQQTLTLTRSAKAKDEKQKNYK